jgi:hypothetical protein
MHADVLSNNAKWSVAILSWLAGVLHFTPVVLTHQWCHVGSHFAPVSALHNS